MFYLGQGQGPQGGSQPHAHEMVKEGEEAAAEVCWGWFWWCSQIVVVWRVVRAVFFMGL